MDAGRNDGSNQRLGRDMNTLLEHGKSPIVQQPNTIARHEAQLSRCAEAYAFMFGWSVVGFVMDIERHAFFTLKDQHGLYEVVVDANIGTIMTRRFEGEMTVEQVVSIITRMGQTVSAMPVAR